MRAPRHQAARYAVGAVLQAVRHRDYALARSAMYAVFIVERARNGGYVDAGFARHIPDSYGHDVCKRFRLYSLPWSIGPAICALTARRAVDIVWKRLLSLSVGGSCMLHRLALVVLLATPNALLAQTM